MDTFFLHFLLPSVCAMQTNAIIAAPDFKVDLVFTDVMMPGVTDGLALAKWIAENQTAIPVIVTSGDQQKASAAKDLTSRFNSCRSLTTWRKSQRLFFECLRAETALRDFRSVMCPGQRSTRCPVVALFTF